MPNIAHHPQHPSSTVHERGTDHHDQPWWEQGLNLAGHAAEGTIGSIVNGATRANGWPMELAKGSFGAKAYKDWLDLSNAAKRGSASALHELAKNPENVEITAMMKHAEDLGGEADKIFKHDPSALKVLEKGGEDLEKSLVHKLGPAGKSLPVVSGVIGAMQMACDVGELHNDVKRDHGLAGAYHDKKFYGDLETLFADGLTTAGGFAGGGGEALNLAIMAETDGLDLLGKGAKGAFGKKAGFGWTDIEGGKLRYLLGDKSKGEQARQQYLKQHGHSQGNEAAAWLADLATNLDPNNAAHNARNGAGAAMQHELAAIGYGIDHHQGAVGSNPAVREADALFHQMFDPQRHGAAEKQPKHHRNATGLKRD